MRVGITDHALLRFIERVYGLNLDPIRKQIETMIAGPARAGASTFTDGKGFTFCFKENGGGGVVVTTILAPGMRQQKEVPHRRKTNNRPRKQHAARVSP